MGFEPTVGFPTLDFESSALNRTQPPFRDGKINVESAYAKSFGVASAERPNIQRPAQTPFCSCTRRRQCCLSGDGTTRHWLNKLGPSCLIPRSATRAWSGRRDLSQGAKNVTILHLPCLPKLLHLVCPHGQPRYYLLLTGIDRLLAPLFTIIRTLFRTSTLPRRHDSTKTRNSANLTYWTA